MIRLRDAATLALTKLRTRKVRLTVTIVVSGLLFSALAGASLVARGFMDGINDFGKEGLGDRYILQANPEPNFDFYSDPVVLERAITINKDIVARKKVEAKRLGLAYDPTTDSSPVHEYETPNGKEQFLDQMHPAAKQAIQEYLTANSGPGLPALEEVAQPYRPRNFYYSKSAPGDSEGGQLQVLKDGKETYGDTFNNQPWDPSGLDSFAIMWTMMSSDMLKPFILPGQHLQTGTDGSIPIIVPFGAAEKLLNMKALPGSASPDERLARTKAVRQKAPTITFEVCYRNVTSAGLVNTAVATQKEIEKNKGKKDYQKPSLIYGLPEQPCGSVPTTRDVRSKEEKTLAAKQLEFDQLFGTPAAEQQKMSFRIVGIVPDADMSTGLVGVGQIVKSLVTSSLGTGWYSPAEEVEANLLAAKLFNNQQFFGTVPSYYVELGSADDARRFLDKENCSVDYSQFEAGENRKNACVAAGTPFFVNAFGNNNLALESAKRGFGKFFGIAALVVSAIAGVIMMGTVGRMIADSRRETAVFRAIGAKKLDIAQIYVVYVICLSLLISLFAIAAGLLLALLAHSRFSPEVTIQAINAYNAQDLDKVFPLYNFYLPDILMLVGLALAAGLLSAVFPLFRNLRRNPIRDMRDDT